MNLNNLKRSNDPVGDCIIKPGVIDDVSFCSPSILAVKFENPKAATNPSLKLFVEGHFWALTTATIKVRDKISITRMTLIFITIITDSILLSPGCKGVLFLIQDNSLLGYKSFFNQYVFAYGIERKLEMVFH